MLIKRSALPKVKFSCFEKNSSEINRSVMMMLLLMMMMMVILRKKKMMMMVMVTMIRGLVVSDV